jgi:predicted  nucleic acid-binding Zn-ribbon protein
MQEEIKVQEKDRKRIESIVPQGWLEKYAIMRTKVTDPVVPVINNSCSACFYDVIGQDLQELRKKKLLQCKECYRFLYLDSNSLQNEGGK